MKKIAFLSGKGGAGKTSLALSVAQQLSDKALLVDCDVDAADTALLIETQRLETKKFHSGKAFTINHDKCIKCGKCKINCPFDAIDVGENTTLTINALKCEGCGTCLDYCKYDAISTSEKLCGEWYTSETRFNSEMIHAYLYPGSDNSGKLVNILKEESQKKGESFYDYVLYDGPPGVGCPAIATISGIDFAVVVVECGASGIHDAERLIELLNKMYIKSIAVLNKTGLSEKMDKEASEICNKNKIPIAGKIPFDYEFVRLLKNNRIWLESEDTKIKNLINDIVKNILTEVNL